ncbi:MAG: hypothetical protein AB1656_18165 [Candidatus Omnitrophota bacterium]
MIALVLKRLKRKTYLGIVGVCVYMITMQYAVCSLKRLFIHIQPPAEPGTGIQ